MSAEHFLSHLQKVRRTGHGRWVASCPAHDDKSPSLNVKEMPDGKMLIICRAGCGNSEILAALGLDWDVLFSADDRHTYAKEAKRAFPAADILRALVDESLLVSVAALNVANGVELTAEDKARLLTAHKRIEAAKEMALGS